MLYLLNVGTSILFCLDEMYLIVILHAFILIYTHDLSCCGILKGVGRKAAYLCAVKT